MIQSILAKILTEKRYERQTQEIKNQKHKKTPKIRVMKKNLISYLAILISYYYE